MDFHIIKEGPNLDYVGILIECIYNDFSSHSFYLEGVDTEDVEDKIKEECFKLPNEDKFYFVSISYVYEIKNKKTHFLGENIQVLNHLDFPYLTKEGFECKIETPESNIPEAFKLLERFNTFKDVIVDTNGNYIPEHGNECIRLIQLIAKEHTRASK